MDRVEMVLSDSLVERFAALTGDVSSLHVDAAFARRSQYRRPVAHGMLPLAFLPLAGPLRRPGTRCVPTVIQGRFTSPIFVGEAVELKVEAIDSETFRFEVVAGDSGKVATRGKLQATFEPAPPPGPRPSVPAGSLVSSASPLRTIWFEEIIEGLEETPLEFEMGPSAVEGLCALLRQAIGDGAPNAATLEAGFDLGLLFPTLLFSTSVGVSLPGTPATFLEFQARGMKRTAGTTGYTLRGRVSHRSGATSIIKKAITVSPNDEPDRTSVEGTVSVLVNKPARSMPTMDELRGVALDLGLRGKVVLVTGASRGIGETIAKVFALAGSRVVVNYYKGAADAERVVQEISAAGGTAMALGADVSDEKQVDEMVTRTVQRFGSVDVLVNNAARDFRPTPFPQLTWAEIEADMAVIVRGAFFCCQRAIPHMLERGGGKIVNVSTLATEIPPPGQLKYVLAKSALDGLTRALAAEFANKNIQVNSVVPNFVETDLVAHVTEGFRKKIADEIPMGRMTSPVEVARAVLFLASDYSSYTTGQRLAVTGGSPPYL